MNTTELVSYLWSKLSPIRHYYQKKWFTIILYHEISPKQFKTHLSFYQANYNLTPLVALKKYYYEGFPLPKNPLFITFDDGWRSNYDLLPIVKKERIPITIFLTTNLIGSTKIPPPLSNNKQVSTNQQVSDNPERKMLNIEEIKEMVPYFNFQSHGVNHYNSLELSETQLNYELCESKRIIESITGEAVYAFAYPYNRTGIREAEIVKMNGYSLARKGDRVLNSCTTNQYLLHCIGIEQKCTINELKNKLLRAELKTLKNTPVI